MVNKSMIVRNLNELNRRYLISLSDRNPRISMYYSKLCVIELCGWIELTMDDMIKECANKYMQNGRNIDYVENAVVRGTHSFSYKDHFRRMLIQTIGIINVERLENNLDTHKFELLKSGLGSLKQERNRDAHSYLKDVTQTVLAPSRTVIYFNQVYEGLKDLEKCLKRLKL